MNPNCPACKTGKQHTEDEWKAFHPLAGHGFTKEQGFSSALAKAAHEEDERMMKDES